MNFKKERLDFKNTELTEFPKEVFNHKKLRKLSLKDNKIKSIPKEVSELKYLETLDLSNNNITSLFAKIFELPRLRILILEDNQIVNIPKQVKKLQSLKILSLANNKLTSLPAELGELKNLEELNISANSFTTFPIELLNLKKLHSLWLSKNKFINFPADRILADLPLQRLYCYSYNLDDSDTINNTFLELSKIPGNSLSHLHRIYSPKQKEIQSLDESINEDKHVDRKNKNKIFISYSHRDREWLSRIKVHLKALTNEGLAIDVWDDSRIKSGQKWQEEIEKALNEAAIAILLISADFIASDFIIKNELPPLLKGAELKGTKIIPVIISPSRFIQNKSLSIFQSINDPKEEVLSDLPNNKQESIYVRLASVIDEYVM